MLGLFQMRQQLIPALLLAAALSHVLTAPLDTTQTLGYDGQTNDNTFRNIYSTIFCKEVSGISNVDNSLQPCSYYRQRGYQVGDNRRTYEGTPDKDYKYNGEGFRKEQWHNYPRQLDRLQHSPYDRNKPYVKRNFEPDDYEGSVDSPPDSLSKYLTTNEYVLTNDAPQNVYDSLVASTGPLLILKIRLACLNSGKVNRSLADAARDIMARLETNDQRKNINDKELREQPNEEIVPSKRDASSKEQDIQILGKKIEIETPSLVDNYYG